MRGEQINSTKFNMLANKHLKRLASPGNASPCLIEKTKWTFKLQALVLRREKVTGFLAEIFIFQLWSLPNHICAISAHRRRKVFKIKHNSVSKVYSFSFFTPTLVIRKSSIIYRMSWCAKASRILSHLILHISHSITPCIHI